MDIINDTPYQAHVFYRGLIGGALEAYALIKATFRIEGDLLVEDPDPFPVWETDQEIDGAFFEKDVSLTKGGVDLVVLGSAYPSKGGLAAEMDVALELDGFRSVLRIIGNRYWVKVLGKYRISDPKPFDRMPVTYENAFGGKDTTQEGHEIPFVLNPAGKGYIYPGSKPKVEGVPLPNVENPEHRIKKWKDAPDPVGFAWYRMEWGLRAINGVEVIPMQPPRILPRLFNGAHPSLVLSSYPAGKTLKVTGMTPSGTFACTVPELPLRVLTRTGDREQELPFSPDTLCVLPEKGRLYVAGRAMFPYDPPSQPDMTVVIAPKAGGGRDGEVAGSENSKE